MDKQSFLELVWEFERIMMHRDYLRNQIGKCGEGCDDEDEGLCPACCDIFEKVLAEDERLAKDSEFNEVLKSLKKACDDDKSGEFETILNRPRNGKVFH